MEGSRNSDGEEQLMMCFCSLFAVPLPKGFGRSGSPASQSKWVSLRPAGQNGTAEGVGLPANLLRHA